jgi:hypothetical protein
LSAEIRVDGVMAELHARVRERIRARLAAHGGSAAVDDPVVFAEIERLLQRAVDAGDAGALVLPELLGDPETWRLQTAMRYQSHRRGPTASAIVFLKRRILMPVLRWLFEYSRDNFERQRRVNAVLFACVQELAAETARLRQELQRARGGSGVPRQ